jgi:hypothetical protein
MALPRYDPENPRRFAIHGWDSAVVDKVLPVVGSVLTGGDDRRCCSSGSSPFDLSSVLVSCVCVVVAVAILLFGSARA